MLCPGDSRDLAAAVRFVSLHLKDSKETSIKASFNKPR
jgi:hypothetical protein